MCLIDQRIFHCVNHFWSVLPLCPNTFTKNANCTGKFLYDKMYIILVKENKEEEGKKK